MLSDHPPASLAWYRPQSHSWGAWGAAIARLAVLGACVGFWYLVLSAVF